MQNMPDFLLIGVGKSGTTSIHNYLDQHPQIAMTEIKEPHFFEFGEPEKPPDMDMPPISSGVIKTLSDYQALFSALPAGQLHGEAAPSNFEPRACARIALYIPQGKFICVLRHPVDRAYSAYQMQLRLGNEPERDFRRAYEDKQRWERRFTDRLPPYSYRNASWYVSRLQDWFSRFQRRQIYIGLYDDLKADPISFMQSLYLFLNVDETFKPDTSQKLNQGYIFRNANLSRLISSRGILKQWWKRWVPQSIRQFTGNGLKLLNRAQLSPLNPELRRELTLPQNESILQLQDLIGLDLTHWLAK